MSLLDEDKLQKEIGKYIESINRSPVEDFDNLSSEDMHHILYDYAQEGSPVQWAKDMTADMVAQSPFYAVFRIYLERIEAAGELKLTTIGNLSAKLCRELYDLSTVKERLIEAGLYKLSSESKSIIIQSLKLVGFASGLTKKKHNKLSLTAQGKKMLAPGQEVALFKTLFLTHIKKFNLAYFDGYVQTNSPQGVFGYTLYLLLTYGAKARSFKLYADKTILAFPHMTQDFIGRYGTPEEHFTRCYYVRIFDRFLRWYGLTEIVSGDPFKYASDYSISFELQATDLLRQLFYLEKSNFHFQKAGYEA